jgi:hypothetical protein
VTVDEPAAGLIPTLPGRYYTDPGIFSAEQAAIFESMWFCAMRSADVAGPGGFRTVQIGRESVIVARDTDGCSTPGRSPRGTTCPGRSSSSTGTTSRTSPPVSAASRR